MCAILLDKSMHMLVTFYVPQIIVTFIIADQDGSKQSTSESNTQTGDDTEHTLKPDEFSPPQKSSPKKTKTSEKPKKCPRHRTRPSSVKTTPTKVRQERSRQSSRHVSSSAKSGSSDDSNQKVEVQVRDQSTSVNTLGEEFGFRKLSSSDSSEQKKDEGARKSKKTAIAEKKNKKIQEIIELTRLVFCSRYVVGSFLYFLLEDLGDEDIALGSHLGVQTMMMVFNRSR